MFQRKRSAPTAALANVSMCVERGECVALVGPNGAGKSTLIRMLATLIQPSSGSAIVNGYDVTTEPRLVRRSIGLMTGDDRSFFWPLTAIENLEFFGELHGMSSSEARRRAGLLLDEVGLAAAAERRVSGYSAGMRQRLNIARALLHEPEILLLDEPTANLDLVNRRYVIDMLRQVTSDGSRSALVATHDAGLVVAVADRTLRLESGTLVQERTAQESTGYRIVVGGIPVERLQLLGSIAATENGRHTLSVVDLGDGHALSSAISEVVADGGEVLAIETIESPREDYS